MPETADRAANYDQRVGAILRHEFGCPRVAELLHNYINDHGQPPYERLLAAEKTYCKCHPVTPEEMLTWQGWRLDA